jgi:tRNA U34 5-carboxymethylaminomethyl modifying GTPase MnmE/TrmE
LQEQRATIEDELVIGGIGFRFIDTGISETQDVVESIGIKKHSKNRTSTSRFIFV